MPALPTSTRTRSSGALSLDDARDAVAAVVRGESARRSAHAALRRAAQGGKAELALHDGDLVLDELRTGIAPFLSLLIVRGKLIVRGLYADCLDPESIVIVTGDLHADRLISESFLEVHGSLVVEREALWDGNDGCADVFGELRASFVYSRYHTVAVRGAVVTPLVLGDQRYVSSPASYPFVCETDTQHQLALRAALPAASLAIEGDPDSDDPEDWWIDHIRFDELAAEVRAGRPVLARGWPPPVATP